MSEHSWAQNQIAAYIAGGLDAHEDERFESHVKDCADCSAGLAVARQLDRELESLLAPAKPGPALEDRMIRSLHVIRAVDVVRPRWKRRLLIGIAASAALGLTGAGMTLLVGNGEIPWWPTRTDDARHPVELSTVLQRDRVHTPIGIVSSSSGPASPAPDPEAMARTIRQRSLAIVQKGIVGWGENSGRFDEKGSHRFAPESKVLTGASGGFESEVDGISMRSRALGSSAPIIQDAQRSKLKSGDFSGGQQETSNRGYGLYFVPTAHQPATASVTGKDPDKEGKENKPAGVGYIAPVVSPPANPDLRIPLIVAPEPAAPRKIIIRTGEVEFEIESFDSAVAVAIKLVSAIKNGYVATINSEKLANGKVKGSIVVRIPPESLDRLVLDLRRDLGKDGELKGQRIGSQDITKQYTDTESRLKAARTMEQRLLLIIKEGKGEIKQLLEAEKELGVWRTKIEEMEGELRFFSNQVALSTLTITLTEREIKSIAGLTESERVQSGIEVEDVEKAQQLLIKAVTEAKGRVTKSELSQKGMGQYNATVNFEVAPEQAGPLRDSLRQLGLVTRLEVDRVQKAESGTVQKDAKVKRGDTVFLVQLYNITNVAPRETATLQIAAPDVPAAYRALQSAVAGVKGRVLKADLNEQDRMNVLGQLDFEVRRGDEAVIQAALLAAGDVYSRSATRAAEDSSTTDGKVRFNTTLMSSARLTPRETTRLGIEVGNVDQTVTVFTAQVNEAKGRVMDSNISYDRSGQIVARMVVDVPLASKEGLVERFKSAGAVKSQEDTRDPKAHDGRLAIARIEVVLANGPLILSKDDGLWAQVRGSLAFSARALMFSLSFLIVGLCVVLPWGIVGYGGYRLVRRLFRSVPASPTA